VKCFKCGGIFDDDPVINLMLSPMSKEFLKIILCMAQSRSGIQ